MASLFYLEAMAEASAMMNIDSETLRSKITCGICHKHYCAPKTLPCLHSFCLACLKAVSSVEKNGEFRFSCPDCKKEMSCDKNTFKLEDLPDSFQINRHLEYHKFKQKSQGLVEVICEKCVVKKVKATGFCTNCTKFICDLCLQIHSSWSDLKHHKTLKLTELKGTYQKYIPVITAKEICPVHTNECTIFCETCEILVCHECIVKGQHRDHEYYHSDESAKKHKKLMTEHLDSINHLPVQLQSAITVINDITQNFSLQAKTVEKQLLHSLDLLEQKLAKVRQQTTKGLSNQTKAKMQLLDDQKQVLEHTMTQISSCIEFVTDTTENKHITEFFLLEKQMLARISELHEEFTQLDLTPVEEPEVHFTLNRDLFEDLETSLKISDGSILHAGAANSHVYSVGEVICFFVALSSAFYKTKTNPMEEIQAEIQSIRDGSICPATVAVSSNGFAKLQCSFSERGRYTVSVRIGGNHINGSPYKLFVKPNGTQLQKPIKSIVKLQGPKGIAINDKHHMIVCEENRHTVSVFGRKSKKLVSIGEYGKNNSQFSHPTGVAVDSGGFVYVADSKNDRIQKFDQDGVYLCEYRGEKRKSTHLQQPSSVKIGPNGKLYVIDRGNGRIVILNKKLEYLYSFGSAGYGLGSLQDPWDLAFDENGFIYITDRRQHCIQIFTDTGAFRGKIGNQGQQKGKLNNPAGIAIDRFGKIYVCESGNHRVSIFHTSSEFLECFSIGLGMVNPCGVTIDADGFIYVSSAETVHVF